jgi:hypothetical protein
MSSHIPKHSFLRVGMYLSSFFEQNKDDDTNDNTFSPLINSSGSETCDKLIANQDFIKNELLVLVQDVQEHVHKSIESDKYINKSIIQKTQKQLVNRMFAYNKVCTKIKKFNAKHL